jgi:hypothetical protein
VIEESIDVSLKNHPKALYLPVGLCYNRMRYMVMSFATCNQCYQQQYKQYQYLSGISKLVMAVLLVMKLKMPSQVELESYSATQCLGISLTVIFSHSVFDHSVLLTIQNTE